jgi:hypothetical protein
VLAGFELTPTALRTRSIRAAEPLLAPLLHRQSVGALTSRAPFPSHRLRSRNRLPGALEADECCNARDERQRPA